MNTKGKCTKESYWADTINKHMNSEDREGMKNLADQLESTNKILLKIKRRRLRRLRRLRLKRKTNMTKELTAKQIQSRGGRTTKKRYGIEHFKKIQKIGVEVRKLNKLNNNK